MSSVLLFSEMKQSLFFIRFRMDLPRRVAGGVNSSAEGVFVQRRLGEEHRLPLGTFSTGNAPRMASLIWASHMEQAMPETLIVVRIIKNILSCHFFL